MAENPDLRTRVGALWRGLVDDGLYRYSAEYKLRMDLLRKFLESADQAMDKEAVGPETRQRVLNRILYGHSNPEHWDRLDPNEFVDPPGLQGIPRDPPSGPLPPGPR
jgi:hypothetical protein